MTLEEALALVAASDLTETRKTEVRRDCGNLAKRLQISPARFDIRCPTIRKRIGALTPAGLGITRNRLDHLLSAWRTLLKVADPTHRFDSALEGPWAAMEIAVKRTRAEAEGWKAWYTRPLCPFLRYAAGRGLAPEQVTLAVIDDYVEHWQHRHPNRDGSRLRRDVRLGWERARQEIPGWPNVQLGPVRQRNWHALPLDAFSEAFRRDLEAYLHHRGLRPPETNLLKDLPVGSDAYLAEARLRLAHSYIDGRGRTRFFKPLKQRTLDEHRYTLIAAASELVQAGKRAVEEIDSLAAVATPEAAATLVAALRARRQDPNRPVNSASEASKVLVLMAVAERWSGLSDDDRAVFKALAGKIKADDPYTSGLTPRVRERLQPFHDGAELAKLYTLPDRIFARLERRRREGPVTPADARLAEAAVAIVLQFIDPLRRDNLAHLHLDKSFVWPDKPRRPTRLRVDRSTVKNGRDLHADLPPARLRLLQLHLAHYRPLLAADPENRYLFPPRRGDAEALLGPRDAASLAGAVTKVIRDETGHTVNLHLFRTLAALVLYQFSDGNRRLVEDVLGHTRDSRATDHYLEISHGWASSKLRQAYEAQWLDAHRTATGRARRNARPQRRPS